MNKSSWRDVRDAAKSASQIEINGARSLKFLLILTFLLWISIGFYSAYATFQGFNRLNWGLLAIILTSLAQIGAMIYPFIIKKIYYDKSLTKLISCSSIILILVLGIVFHIVSFLGSIYYHSEAAGAPLSKRNVGSYEIQLQNIISNARHNNLLPKEMDRIIHFYKTKTQEEVDGSGVTELKSFGPYARSYHLLAQATANLKMQFPTIELPLPQQLSETTTNEQAFEITYNYYLNLPSELFPPKNNVSRYSLTDWREKVPRPINPKNEPKSNNAFLFNPNNFELTNAEQILRRYLYSFPFKEINKPVLIHGAPQEVFKGIFSVFKNLRSEDDIVKSKSQAGFVGAILTELLTIIFNFSVLYVFIAWTSRPKLGPFLDFVYSSVYTSNSRNTKNLSSMDKDTIVKPLFDFFEKLIMSNNLETYNNEPVLMISDCYSSTENNNIFNDILFRHLLIVAHKSNIIFHNGPLILLRVTPIQTWFNIFFKNLSLTEVNIDYKSKSSLMDLLKIGLPNNSI